MGLDLRDGLRERLIIHPRLTHQNLWTGPGDAGRIAAELPPLVPFGKAEYVGATWILDWDLYSITNAPAIGIIDLK